MLPQRIPFALTCALTCALALSATATTALAQEPSPGCEMPFNPTPPAAVTGRTVLEQASITLPGAGAAAPVAIQLEAGRSYVIETYGLSGATDTILSVRRGSGGAGSPSDAVVAENDDVESGTLWSRVRITATTAGTYFAHVRPYDPSTGGTFGLRVTEVAASEGPLRGPKIR